MLLSPKNQNIFSFQMKYKHPNFLFANVQHYKNMKEVKEKHVKNKELISNVYKHHRNNLVCTKCSKALMETSTSFRNKITNS